MADITELIYERLSGIIPGTDREKAGLLNTYYNMVVEYNEKVNLTAITEPEDFVTKHFIDSLLVLVTDNVSRETFAEKKKPDRRQSTGMQSKAAAEEEAPRTDNVSRETLIVPDAKLIDIGTGAGFPGIPLAIFRPDIKITLLDSLAKRVSFLESVIKELGLGNVTALHGRAEDYAHSLKHRESFDICVTRAVAPLPVITELCLPYVANGGYFIAYKTADCAEEVNSAENALRLTGGRIESIDRIGIPDTDIVRSLINIKKVKTTIKKYPRKAGTPKKDPL